MAVIDLVDAYLEKIKFFYALLTGIVRIIQYNGSSLYDFCKFVETVVDKNRKRDYCIRQVIQ